MKLEQNQKNLLFEKTEIPDIFFNEYLSMANGDFIKVYLYMLFLSKYNKDVKIADLSKSLNLQFSVIQEAIKFWEDNGLIIRKTNGYIIKDLQEITLNKLYKAKITISNEDIENNQKTQKQAKAIEAICNSCFQGVMSPTWYNDILLWFAKYEFDEQVMMALFQYCYGKSALHKNYIQTVAEAWHKNNVKTYTDLENYTMKQENIKKSKHIIAKKLGLTRALTSFEEEYIDKWITEFNYDLDIIEIALKKSTSKLNISFDYIDKIISNWYERNLKTKEDINKYLAEFKQKQKNIKELEKKSKVSNTNYEQRNYDNLDSLYANISGN